MQVEDLQSAVSELTAEELAVFAKWFEEFFAEQWDRQIEADILAGRLDAAAKLRSPRRLAGSDSIPGLGSTCCAGATRR